MVSVLSGLSGCGYTFQGSGSILPDDVKTVAVNRASNNTTVPGLGLQLTQALRARFERYGVVRVVDSKDAADAVLNARISDIRTDIRDTTGNTDIEVEQEIVLTLAAELRRKNGQVLWRNNKLKVSETFASVSDLVVTSSSQFSQSGITGGTLSSLGTREVSRGQQQEVLDDLIDEASRKIYIDAVAEDF